MRFLGASFVTVCVAIIAEAKVALVAMDGGHTFTAIARRCCDLPRTALFHPPHDTIHHQLIVRSGADGAARRARKPDRSVTGCAGVGRLGGGGELARIAEGNRVQASQELEKQTTRKATASGWVRASNRVWPCDGAGKVVVVVVVVGGGRVAGEGEARCWHAPQQH